MQTGNDGTPLFLRCHMLPLQLRSISTCFYSINWVYEHLIIHGDRSSVAYSTSLTVEPPIKDTLTYGQPLIMERNFVCKLTSEMRTTSLQGTTEMFQCVHYSEFPLYTSLVT